MLSIERLPVKHDTLCGFWNDRSSGSCINHTYSTVPFSLTLMLLVANLANTK